MYTSIKFKLIAGCCIFLLVGCIGYPVSDAAEEVEILGDPESNESLIRERRVHGMQYIISPEGPRRMVHGGSSSYAYYFKKGETRQSLPFLYINKTETDWDSIVNVDRQWFAISLSNDVSNVIIMQFNANGLIKKHFIPVLHAGAVERIYIDKRHEHLLWKQINNAYFSYSLESEKSTRIDDAAFVVDEEYFVKVPDISARYDAVNFFDVVASSGSGFSGSNLREMAETSSVDILEKSSTAIDYLSRWAVAINPNTPVGVLNKLKNDKSYYVANEARKQLDTRKDDED